ncbi:MAG: amidoligase family protein [Alphaproteobacteria bacterium]|nr:amidoligase family protein [Alphaproteobacteria bacterium]
MPTRSRLRLPPRRENFEGNLRRVGVEIEFAAVSAARAAERVATLYGGNAEREDPHRYHIKSTRLGDFLVELDTQYAHRTGGPQATSAAGFQGFVESFSEAMREIYGDLGSLIIPYEVVCPPISVEQLDDLEGLIVALREEGATGTNDNLLHAFGCQLNPDIATRDPQWILAVLKAEILLSDWLRSVISIDLARQILAFADPFPQAYRHMVLAQDYWPDTDKLIDDYLTHNPTRNRELDMLPLFMWLDEDRVRQRIPDKLVKSRPTFHYRLPDARIREATWSLTLEWNRWCVVERLAEDREMLAQMGKAYTENDLAILSEDWALRCTEWLML